LVVALCPMDPSPPAPGAPQPHPAAGVALDDSAEISQQDATQVGDPATEAEATGVLESYALDYDDIDDVAGLALLSRVVSEKTRDEEAQEPTLYEFGDAADAILWALDLGRRGKAGLDPPPRMVPWGKGLHRCCLMTFVVLLTMLILVMTRLTVREVSVKNGVMLMGRVPAFSGEEPVAKMAALVRSKPFTDVPELPVATLRHIREVVFIHHGLWRCIRISRVIKISQSHVWLQAFDGTRVRIHDGQAFLRPGILGTEEKLHITGEPFPTINSTAVIPSGYFQVMTVSGS